MNTADEQAADEYYSILLTYIRELNKAHKGIRRLARRNAKQKRQIADLQRLCSRAHAEIAENYGTLCDGDGFGPRNLERDLRHAAKGKELRETETLTGCSKGYAGRFASRGKTMTDKPPIEKAAEETAEIIHRHMTRRAENMNTIEQLIDLHSRLKHMKENRVAVPLLDSDEELIAQLIAERPYEPGDTILVTSDGVEAEFIATHSSDKNFVWAVIPNTNGLADVFFKHRPLPKTCRVKPVPEEVMEAATKILRKDAETKEEIGKSWYKEETIRMAEWLANPENWEGGNE